MDLIGMDIESSPSRDTMDTAAIKVHIHHVHSEQELVAVLSP